MSKIKINHPFVTEEIVQQLKEICPFNAFLWDQKNLSISAACKVCKLCVKKGPKGVCEYEETTRPMVDKSLWQGITVFAEQSQGILHPVTYELIGKAQELAQKISTTVSVVLIGSNLNELGQDLLSYGVNHVYLYEDDDFLHFTIEIYSSVMEHYILTYKPSVLLIGATLIGRSFAPRIAARFRTGLTADCTALDIKENTDLVQIRPAFGGNIMASILTTYTRPQIATVRYKVFKAAIKTTHIGEMIKPAIPSISHFTHVETLDRSTKEKQKDVVDAEIIVACGAGIKSQNDLLLAYQLAEALGGEVACTRPLIEKGWMDPKRQIGLSGRTVSPKLLITLGISGSVQFVAGIKSSQKIIAINRDKYAPIMDVAHLGLIGDLYEIIPQLLKKIKEGGEIHV